MAFASIQIQRQGEMKYKHKSYTFFNTITSNGPGKILEVLQISYHRYIRQIYLITHILGKYIKYILDKPCHLEKNATFDPKWPQNTDISYCIKDAGVFKKLKKKQIWEKTKMVLENEYLLPLRIYGCFEFI